MLRNLKIDGNMNPVYLMTGLGLGAPILKAIREGLPVYQVLRQLVTFFVDNGFSLTDTDSFKGFETFHLRMQNTAEVSESDVALHYHTDGTILGCVLQVSVPRRISIYEYSLGKKATLRTSVRYNNMGESFYIRDRDLPYDLALQMYTSRILAVLYP